MKFEKYLHFSTVEFVLDDDFLKWILHPNQESDLYWNEFMHVHPHKKKQIKEAILLVKAIRISEPSLTFPFLQKEFEGEKHSRAAIRLIVWKVARVASIFLLLVAIGGVLYFTQSDRQTFSDMRPADEQFENGKIILPDGTVNIFETEETHIQLTKNGELTINDDTLSIEKGNHKRVDKNAMAKVIIPYGKRSVITLSDGTKIWLNSGSFLTYPIHFKDKHREVYLSGEAFFDVSSNPDKPFHVITDDMKIRVTGTRFNVTSYINDQTTQAVLVSGKIDAAQNKKFAKPMELNPGERIVFSKNDEIMKKDNVNVELYSSWINGYLVFDKEPLGNIVKKLERYYNKEIKTGNLDDQPTFTGKLNLADNLDDVLKNIEFSVSFSWDYEKNE